MNVENVGIVVEVTDNGAYLKYKTIKKTPYLAQLRLHHMNTDFYAETFMIKVSI